MQNLEHRYAGRQDRQEARRQLLGSLALLLVVLGLAAVCAVAYFHARGGSVSYTHLTLPTNREV